MPIMTGAVWGYIAVNQEAPRAAGNSRNEEKGLDQILT